MPEYNATCQDCNERFVAKNPFAKRCTACKKAKRQQVHRDGARRRRGNRHPKANPNAWARVNQTVSVCLGCQNVGKEIYSRGLCEACYRRNLRQRRKGVKSEADAILDAMMGAKP